MKRFIKICLLALLAAGLPAVSLALNVGSHETAAPSLTATSSATRRAITLTREYNDSDGTYSSDSYCYYCKFTLTKGTPYTFKISYRNDAVDGAIVYFDSGDSIDPDCYTDYNGSDFDEEYVILPKGWSDVTVSSVTMYVYFYGVKDGQVYLSYQAAIDLPLGTPENPEVLEVPDAGTATKTVTLDIENFHADGAYHFNADLVAGRKYIFKTTSGTESLTQDLDVVPVGLDVDYPARSPLSDVDAYNGGYAVIPYQSATYEIVVSSSDSGSATIQYGGMASRLPSQHDDIRVLTNAVRQACTPGQKHADGSSYYDEVIDRQLFLFTAKAGSRYKVETDGAVVPLLLEAYDASGNVLALNSACRTNDANCRIAIETSAAGTYYVGLCENIDDEDTYDPSGLSVGIKLSDISGTTAGFDSFDPVDDVWQGASSLSPVLTADMNAEPRAIDVEGHGPHCLSANDWCDTYVLACRAGLSYDIQIVAAATNGNLLAVEVFTRSEDGSEVAVDSHFSGNILSFDASQNAAHYVRISALSFEGETGHGLDYPEHTVHCVARSYSSSEYGYLTVDMRGPAQDSGATWKIAGGTGATEPWYPFGTTIAEKGTLTLEASAVDGFSTPAGKTATIVPGFSTNVVFTYNDSYDTGDDVQSGAVAMAFSSETNFLDRTLWEDDPADWFSFEVRQGIYYNIRFSGATGTPSISVIDANGNLLAQSESGVSVAASQTGTYYAKIDHGTPGDASYRLACWSVNVGTVGFANGESYSVREDAGYVEIPVSRTSLEGTVSIRYGTVSGTAVAGEDYLPVSGVLTWEAGDSAAKSIRIPLLPEERPVYEGDERFFLKIEPVAAENDGEYAPVVSAPDVARVTVTDSSAPSSPGTVSIAASGDGKAPVTNSTVRVAPGEAARIWISRGGGTNGRAVCEVAAVDGTAKMGNDYLGETPRKIVWESGEDGEKCVMFTTSPEVASLKSFTVKISEIFGNGQVSPAAGTKTVSVVIDPGKPAPEYDETALGSAVGSFRGVLREQTGAGTENRVLSGIGVLVSESGISATLSVAGSEVVFSGDGFDSESGVYAKATLSRVHVIDGVEYEDTLVLDILKKPLASYEVEGFPWFEGTATANIFIPNADGITADEYIYTGDIHRDNTALPLYATSIAPFAGKYTVAFVPEALPQETEPKGLSTLTLTVAADGTVSGTGVLADGVEVAVSSKASISGSLAAPDDDSDDMLFDFYGLVIPVYCGTETMAFGGDLNIFHNGGKPAVFCSGEECEYFREGRSDVSSTEFGESGYTFIAMPIGGIYDGTVNRAYLAIGKEYSVDSGEWALVDTNGMDCASLTTNADGIVTGTISTGSGSYSVSGVEIMNRDPDLSAAFANIAMAGRIEVPSENGGLQAWTDTYPVYVRAYDADPDWTEDFGLSSTITFNGNGNTEGYAPASVVAQVKSTEFIPEIDTNTFKRTGYDFVCWRDEAGSDYSAGDEFEVPVSNTTLTAVWTFSVAGVAEALDCTENTNLVFVAGGEAPWIPQTETVCDSPSAIRSGAIEGNAATGGGGTSWIETKVYGQGRVSFWYKVSCISVNYLSIAIDGVEESFSGNVGWTEYVKDLSEGGGHTIRWTYARQNYTWSDSSYSDRAWIDRFAFGPTVTVMYDPTEGTMSGDLTVRKVVGSAFGTMPVPECATKTFDGWRDATGAVYTADSLVPDYDLDLVAAWREKEWTVSFASGEADSGNLPASLSGIPGTKVALPDSGTLAKAGYEFAGWSDGTTVRPADASYTIGSSDVVMTAQWSLSVAGVGKALGNTNLVYSAGGDAAWYAQSDVVLPSGSDAQAVRSGAIGNGGTTWLETQVSGSGRLSFWYKVSCTSVHSLSITIDGVEEKFSGNIDWTEYVREFTGSGTHTIRWTYTKASYGWDDGSADAAWVDELRFGPTVTVTFDPTVGTMTDERSVRKVVGSPFGALPRPESATMTFDYWRDGDGARYSADTVVPDHDVALTAEWKDKEWEVRFDGGIADSGNPPEVQTGLPGAEIVLPGPGTLAKAGYEFIGWSDGTTIRTNGATYVVGAADVTMTAQWSLSVAGIGEALDASEFVYSAGGDAPWFAQAEVTHGTSSAIRSGAIGTGGGTSWIETQIKGAGQLSFWYKCETFQGMDKLTVTIDGAEAGTYSGTVDWTRFEHEFTSGGAHTVRWTYSRTTSWDTGIANCAWVDELQFGPTVTVTFDPTVGTMTDERSVRKVVGSPFGALPRPESATMTFDYWRDDDGARYSAATVVPDHDVALTAEWKDKEWEVRFEGGAADSGNPPEVQTGLPGAEIVLPGPGTLAKSGYEFVGWSDGTTIRTNGATYVVGTADVTMTAQWSLSVTGYAGALDSDAPVYTAGGNSAWYVDSAVYDASVPGNESALRSGYIPPNTAGDTWCKAQVSGAGVLSFRWKVSALAYGNCHFKVTVDGVEVISQEGGDTGWREYVSNHLEEGTHTVCWAYSTESWAWEDPSVQNCAWIDCLIWTPDKPAGYEFEIVNGTGVSAVVVSNGTDVVEVEDGKFTAEVGAQLTFAVSSAEMLMPVFAAQFEGSACDRASYGVYSFTVGESGGTFTFTAQEAADQADNPVAQAAAKEAIIASVDSAAPGKTLEETRVLVAGQIDVILAAHSGAKASDVAQWICDNGFTSAEFSVAKDISVSYGLEASTLFALDPVAEILAMDLLGSSEGDALAFELTFRIKDGESGEAAVAAATERAKSYVETLVKTTSDISDWSKTVDGAIVTAAYEVATASIKVVVSFPHGFPSAFVKVEK